MFKLNAKQWQSINEFQKNELNIILTKSAQLNTNLSSEHYSCIGKWAKFYKPNKVLELGCGPGRYVAILGTLGCEVVGADPISYDTWPMLLSKLKKARFESDITAESLPYQDKSFDGVACLGAMLYFDNPNKALFEIRRVLREDGKLILRTVNKENLFTKLTGKKIDPDSKNLYSIDELCKLLEINGFSINEKFSYGFFPPFLTQYWWYLVNGKISLPIQKILSNLTPSRYRVNITIFATMNKAR